jgi:hypothetical protein
VTVIATATGTVTVVVERQNTTVRRATGGVSEAALEGGARGAASAWVGG